MDVMTHRTRTVALLLALLLPLAACGGPDAAPDPTPAAPDAPAATTPDVRVDDAAVDTAVRWERLAREWGTDPTVDPAGWNGGDIARIISQVRTGALSGDDPAAGLESFVHDTQAGPDAVNPLCPIYEERRVGDEKVAGYVQWCETVPRAGDWWAMQAIGMGVRWTDGPNATVTDDGRVRVRGTVRVMLVQGDEDAAYGRRGPWFTVTPIQADLPVDDLVTVRDGKVEDVEHSESNPWFIDPWHEAWDTDAADVLQRAGGVRTLIAAHGDVPDWGSFLRSDADSARLPQPRLEGDPDFDWTLWDAVDKGIRAGA